MQQTPTSDAASLTVEEVDAILRSMSDYNSILTKTALINFWLEVRYSLTHDLPVPVEVEE